MTEVSGLHLALTRSGRIGLLPDCLHRPPDAAAKPLGRGITFATDRLNQSVRNSCLCVAKPGMEATG